MANAPADVLADAARRRLTLQTGAQQQKDIYNQDYNTSYTQAQQAMKQKQMDINAASAARGTFDSSVRVDDQGRLTRDYGQQVTNLAQARQRGIQGVDLGVQSGENDIQSMLDTAAREETQRQLNAQLQAQQQQAQQAFYNQQNAYSQQANNQQAQQAAAQAAAERQFWAGIAQQQQQDEWGAAAAFKQQQEQEFWANVAKQQQKDTGNYRWQGRAY
jgi:hypothetical protein